MVIVPMDTPGVRVVPMQLIGDHNINYTFWEDVRVPLSNVVGGLNNGWSLITNQLNHERVTLCSPGIIERALGDVRAWAQQTKLADGRRVIDQEWVRLHLAKVYAKLEFLRLINWKVAWTGHPGPSRRGRRLEHQGVRHRVLHGGAAHSVRGRGPVRVPASGARPVRSCTAGSRASPAGSSSSPSGGGPTRSSATSSPSSAWACPGRCAERADESRDRRWTSPSPTTRRPSASWPPGSSPTSRPPSACGRWRTPKTTSTPSCGPSWARPGCSASRCPSRWAGPGSGSSRPASWPRKRGAAPRPSPSWHRRCSGPGPSPSSATEAAAAALPAGRGGGCGRPHRGAGRTGRRPVGAHDHGPRAGDSGWRLDGHQVVCTGRPSGRRHRGVGPSR